MVQAVIPPQLFNKNNKEAKSIESLYRSQQSWANLYVMWEAPKHNHKAAGIKTSAFKLTYRTSHCVLQKRDVRFPLNEANTLLEKIIPSTTATKA